jgi:hypothetical protein
MKAYWVADAQIHVFLTSAVVGGEWSASGPGLFTPGENTSGTHWRGSLVGPRAGMEEFLILPVLELRSLCRPVRSQSLY